ncbi:MAG: DUF4350 domain-containing protein, partial [Gammaproteobacteria bacterium]|nr:DUF4350 domain-containing protein [Gammaproteobacteria bacterium]
MKNRIALGMVGALLLAGVGWYIHWFLDNYERRYREVRIEISHLARRNPYLAADRFLNRIGVQAESISGRDQLLSLPEDGGTLLVNDFGANLPPEREKALLEWIGRGGHLIVAARKQWDVEEESSGDHLLDQFGVRLATDASPEEDNQEPDVDEAQNEGVFSPVEVSFSDYPGSLKVHFNARRVLEDSAGTATGSIGGAKGYHLLQYREGDGLLSVLSDIRFLTNDHIGEQDHALFLALLIGLEEERVWLLYSSNMPPLVTLLWRYAPHLVAMLVLLTFLALWRLTARTGPLLTGRSVARRNLLEHLEAAAAFAWRTDWASGMFKTSQSAIEQKWLRRHVSLGAMTRRERCQ